MQNIRNIAIIAHVDHGKTTLVDEMIKASELNQKKESEERVMDSQDLEKERGITITAKNVSIQYKGVKINIIDTPGHADFGGEVERVLRMAGGALLLVDSFEGPMPQTRFVLQKAIQLKLPIIVVVNKMDKHNARPNAVHDEIIDLMLQLDAHEDQIEFPILYGSAKEGWMSLQVDQKSNTITPLLDQIIDYIPAPTQKDGVPRFQATAIDFSTFKGKLAIGAVYQGELEVGKEMAQVCEDGSIKKVKIKELHLFEGLKRVAVNKVQAGDLCVVTGLEDFQIGDTITDLNNPEPLPRIKVEEPTISMLFCVNSSPFSGREGKLITSTQIKKRLLHEAERNLALRVTSGENENQFIVSGRGILHLAIFIETMRREGYELQIGKPRVLTKKIDGKLHEPIEELQITLPDESAGKVINLLNQRKGTLLQMENKGPTQHLLFEIPSRGLIGLQSVILTLTKGEAVINHSIKEYSPYRGDIEEHANGSLVAMEGGVATGYAINKLRDRGIFFIPPGREIYKGQVVGEHNRDNDLQVNITKGKKLTNMRASGSDDNLKIPPHKEFTLEETMEQLKEGERMEVTPLSIRICKTAVK